MSEYPDIQRGTQFGDVPARQWQNVFTDLRRVTGMTAGPGLILEKGFTNYRITRTQPTVPSAGLPGVVATLILAVLGGEHDGHLVCRLPTDTAEAFTPILVAKPWLLRKTPWNSTGPDDPGGPVRGEVRYVYDAEDSTKRTAYDINDLPGTPEAERNKRTEMVSPEYLIDDEILAVNAKTGIVVGNTLVTLLALTEGRGWTVLYPHL